MDVFEFREKLVTDYSDFTRSFTRIKARDIKDFVDHEYDSRNIGQHPSFKSIQISGRVPPFKSWLMLACCIQIVPEFFVTGKAKSLRE